jgi:hypothetical protein
MESGGSLIVQWHQVSHFNDCPGGVGVDVTFQAVLFADGSFEFRYLDLDNGDSTEAFGASSTIGIRDASGSAPANGNVLQVSFNSPSVTDGQVIRFTLQQGGPGPGDGGGGDGYGGRRARTSLSLNGPDSADAGDQITLHGKMRCKRERCKANSKVLIFRGNQQIGSTRTDSNGRFSFTTNVPGWARPTTRPCSRASVGAAGRRPTLHVNWFHRDREPGAGPEGPAPASGLGVVSAGPRGGVRRPVARASKMVPVDYVLAP